METVKSIFLKVNLKGRGIVNYDSNDQSYIYNSMIGRADVNGEKSIDGNVSYAKKKWIDIGKHKISISRDCLTHNIYRDEVPFQNENVLHFPSLLLNMIASPTMFLRGYMNATRDEYKLKRTGVVTLTDAIQTNSAISSMETFSRSGVKTDTGFFKKETIGDIEYQALGAIDLMQLQFLSCDETFDRLALNPDLFEEYVKIFSTRMPFNAELGYYLIKDSIIEIPEYGVKLSNETVLDLTKYFLKKLLGLRIASGRAFAEVVDVEYKLIYDPTIDRLNEMSDNWIKLDNESVNTLNFIPENYYVPVNYDEAIKLRTETDAALKAALDKRKQSKK